MVKLQRCWLFPILIAEVPTIPLVEPQEALVGHSFYRDNLSVRHRSIELRHDLIGLGTREVKIDQRERCTLLVQADARNDRALRSVDYGLGNSWLQIANPKQVGEWGAHGARPPWWKPIMLCQFQRVMAGFQSVV